MTHPLTPEGYAQTKEKLALLETRLAALRQRNDLHPTHRTEAERSYEDMMRQYIREIKLYEATLGTMPDASASPGQTANRA